MKITITYADFSGKPITEELTDMCDANTRHAKLCALARKADANGIPWKTFPDLRVEVVHLAPQEDESQERPRKRGGRRP